MSYNKVYVTTMSPLFDFLYNESAFTWEGMIDTDQNLDAIYEAFEEEGFEPKDGLTFYIIKGKDMNDRYGLTGSNAYQNDLTFVSIPCSDFGSDNGGKLYMWKFQVGARWFDDIVDNNAYRQEHQGSKTAQAGPDYFELYSVSVLVEYEGNSEEFLGRVFESPSGHLYAKFNSLGQEFTDNIPYTNDALSLAIDFVDREVDQLIQSLPEGATWDIVYDTDKEASKKQASDVLITEGNPKVIEYRGYKILKCIDDGDAESGPSMHPYFYTAISKDENFPFGEFARDSVYTWGAYFTWEDFEQNGYADAKEFIDFLMEGKNPWNEYAEDGYDPFGWVGASKKQATRSFTYAEQKELEDEVIDKPWLNNADRLKDPDILLSF